MIPRSNRGMILLMEDGKETLNLTVRANFKRRAAELAKRRRRSISGLFEDLVEEEASRLSDSIRLRPTGSKPPAAGSKPTRRSREERTHHKGVRPKGNP